MVTFKEDDEFRRLVRRAFLALEGNQDDSPHGDEV